jgi:LacI family transcriptional regulator
MSLRDLAKALRLSVATVSRALRNDPSVAQATANRVKEAARKHGYQLNPHVGALMSSLRRGQGETFRGSLAFIWVDLSPRNPVHQEMLPIQTAARKRAGELGYVLDEFVLKDYRPAKLLQILKNRNVQGILFSPSYNPYGRTYLRIPLDNFAVVGTGWAITYPPLYTVRLDQYQAMAVAMHHARHGFKKKGIAAICDFSALRRASYVMRANFLLSHPAGPTVAASLFFESRNLKKERVSVLFKRHKVQTLIVQRDSDCPAWLDSLIPPSNRIYLDKPRPSSVCEGWIDRRYSLVGQWGIETLIGLIQRGEKGIPETPQILLVPPRWVSGKAVL